MMRTMRVTLPFMGTRTGDRKFDTSDKMKIADESIFPHASTPDLDTLDSEAGTVEVDVEIQGEPLLRRISDGVERFLSDIPESEMSDPDIALIIVGMKNDSATLDAEEVKIQERLRGKSIAQLKAASRYASNELIDNRPRPA